MINVQRDTLEPNCFQSFSNFHSNPKNLLRPRGHQSASTCTKKVQTCLTDKLDVSLQLSIKFKSKLAYTIAPQRTPHILCMTTKSDAPIHSSFQQENPAVLQSHPSAILRFTEADRAASVLTAIQVPPPAATPAPIGGHAAVEPNRPKYAPWTLLHGVKSFKITWTSSWGA